MMAIQLMYKSELRIDGGEKADKEKNFCLDLTPNLYRFE